MKKARKVQGFSVGSSSVLSALTAMSSILASTTSWLWPSVSARALRISFSSGLSRVDTVAWVDTVTWVSALPARGLPRSAIRGSGGPSEGFFSLSSEVAVDSDGLLISAMTLALPLDSRLVFFCFGCGCLGGAAPNRYTRGKGWGSFALLNNNDGFFFRTPGKPQSKR